MFCKDFELFANPGINPGILHQIFNRYSSSKGSLYELQFFAVVEELSCYFFNQEYDVMRTTDYSGLGKKEKTKLMLTELGCFDQTYVKRMKGTVSIAQPVSFTPIGKPSSYNMKLFETPTRLNELRPHRARGLTGIASSNSLVSSQSSLKSPILQKYSPMIRRSYR